MAKRKRLTPAQPDYLTHPAALETKAWLRPGMGQPPIAQVAGAAAAASALQEVSDALASARAEGRLVQRLALGVIDVGYLVRDRMATDEEELGHLIESLRAHGQRSPIEVTELAPGQYGLISGWRRMAALARLQSETGDARFGHVLALLRRPDTAEAAYIAMVEENEVRLGLSYYERARIAAKAVDLGVFDSEKQALQRLFAAASRAKRSKIGSFLGIYRRLDAVLRFPAALPERLGLALAKVLEFDAARTDALIAALGRSAAQSAAEEQALLVAAVENRALSGVTEPVSGAEFATPAPAVPVLDNPEPPATAATEEIRPGVFLKVEGGWLKPQLTLSGPNVGPAFRERLLEWLKTP